MNAEENECLNQDDVRLFHRGACHIFAATVLDENPTEGYTLKRVALRKDCDVKEAYHVFAAKDDFVVDVAGIKRSADYLAWLTARHIEQSFGRQVVPLVELNDVSADELLAHHHEHTHLGSVNRWGLFSGEAFVAAARDRAIALIKHWPEKYRVSILTSGIKLTFK